MAAVSLGLVLLSACHSSNETADQSPSPPINEAPIPEPDWGPGEHAARQHTQEFREKLDKVRSSQSPSAQDLAKAYGELGMVYLTYDLNASALPCFDNAGRLDNENFRWPYLKAISHYGLTETLAAAEAMSQAVRRIRQDSAAGSEHLVAALSFLGETSIRLNRIDEARDCFAEVLSLAPDSQFALFKRGQLAALEGESEQALDDFLKAWSLSEKPPPPALSLAISAEYRKLGRDVEAQKYRVTIDPGGKNAAIAYPNLLMVEVRALNRRPASFRLQAEANLSGGRPERALELLAEAVKYSPEAHDLRLLRGEILFAMNRIEAAIDELEAIPDAVRSDASRSLLIQAFARSPATHDKALETAHIWRNEQPEAAKPRMVLGALDFQLGKYQEAYENFATAVRQAPDEAGARVGEAVALCALGNYDAARERLIQAQADFPTSAEVKHHVARFLVTCPDASLRNPARSLALLRELPSNLTAAAAQRETLVCALSAQGDFKEARQVLSDLMASRHVAEQRFLRRRLSQISEALEADRIWTEPWPFAEIKEP